jgi:hypothetical protein
MFFFNAINALLKEQHKREHKRTYGNSCTTYYRGCSVHVFLQRNQRSGNQSERGVDGGETSCKWCYHSVGNLIIVGRIKGVIVVSVCMCVCVCIDGCGTSCKRYHSVGNLIIVV